MFTRAGLLVCAMAVVAMPHAAGVGVTTHSPRVTASGPATFLFEYRVKPGMTHRFEEGYRRHLEWHRRHRDPLPWYGWDVVTGDRLDVFVDGSFGLPFSAFDQRVEPSEDAADFAETAGEFVTPLARRVYRLRQELSSGTPLENRSPSATVDVVQIVLRPGGSAAFERGLAELRTVARNGPAAPYTCYSLAIGGELPTYLVMIVRDGWRALDDPLRSLLDVLSGSRSEAGQRHPVALALRDGARSVTSETWRYRPDLSWLPVEGH